MDIYLSIIWCIYIIIQIPMYAWQSVYDQIFLLLKHQSQQMSSAFVVCCKVL